MKTLARTKFFQGGSFAALSLALGLAAGAALVPSTSQAQPATVATLVAAVEIMHQAPQAVSAPSAPAVKSGHGTMMVSALEGAADRK